MRETVGDDLVLYRFLLKKKELRTYHLDPLMGTPDDAWARKVRWAIKAGHQVESIASQTIGGAEILVVAGDGASLWRGWCGAFEEFLEDERTEVREVAREGIKLACLGLRSAKERRQKRKPMSSL
ncbi:MAG: hypothetical protein KDD47_18275 [Acidobacteria bacterium]|nr:hypothetical protein [Acidobacteriota bacterium]